MNHRRVLHLLFPVLSSLLSKVANFLPSDESLWDGYPQSNQRLDRDDSMDGIERLVRNTMSEVFANRDEIEK
jgi:hypothetical protein